MQLKYLNNNININWNSFKSIIQFQFKLTLLSLGILIAQMVNIDYLHLSESPIAVNICDGAH